MPPDLTDKETERAWALLFHEDNLFHQRLEIFLIAHTLLIAPVGFVLSGEGPHPRLFLYCLALAGLALGLLWWYVQVRSRSIVNRIEGCIDADPIYRLAYPYASEKRRLGSQTTILAVGLPGAVCVCWVAILAALWAGAF